MKQPLLVKLVILALGVLAFSLAINLAWDFCNETFDQIDSWVWGGPEPTIKSIWEAVL